MTEYVETLLACAIELHVSPDCTVYWVPEASVVVADAVVVAGVEEVKAY